MKRTTLIHSLAVAAFAFGFSARADVVTDWNTAALNAIRANRTPPPVVSRQLAILHISIYDAVNGIHGRHKPYLVRGRAPFGASKDVAASAAARKVLLSFFPTNAADFEALHNSVLARVRSRYSRTKGVMWGEHVAAQVLNLRANDGSTAVVTPLPPLGPGDWVPTPPAFAAFLLPQWGHLTCFAMSHPTQFRPPGPPALDSAEYAADFNEVKAYGGATGSLRTPDQDQIALFWADGAGTETPPGHWNSIAQDVGRARRNTMEQNARLFALLNIAMADAAICAWDAKYYFHNWRPVTAIRMADLDGNPDTEADPTWSSFIVTPPFPDYVSGHSTFSGAAARLLARYYGRDNISFTTGSDFLPGVTRSFTSFSDAADEAMNSRLYGGIHYRFANEDGLVAGTKIGDWTYRHYLRPRQIFRIFGHLRWHDDD